MRPALIPLALLAGVPAMAQDGFTNHGVGAPVAELRGAAALHDANGRNILVMVPLDLSARGFLLVLDIDTGETTQVLYPEGVPLAGAFASLLSKTGKFYTGENGFLLEFDPNTRQFTFSGRPHPESGHFVGKSLVDGPDGLVYIGTYPKSHLVSYDPRTREFHDFGQLDPTEEYFNYIGYDDAGWFYAGIGTARMSLVAFDPRTGEKRQLLPDAQRAVGCPDVYTSSDGRAYASAAGKWYRLHEGKAEPIEQAEAGARAPHGSIGYGGVTGGFLDGRTFRVSLEDGWVEVTSPQSGEKKRLTLAYQSGGAGISSMVAGPDGKVYASTNHPMHFVRFDPATGELADLGPVKGVGGGNFCDMAVQGRYICAPSYSSGIFHLFDTTQPFNGGFGDAPNPRELVRWPEDICRPRATIGHPDGRHMFMAGYAGYGRVGGGLGIYDLEAQQATLVKHEQLVPNQSTIALRVLPDGNLVGGTSTDAPGGGHPLAQEAVVYVCDWRARKVLFQTVPVAGQGNIISLEVTREGLVVGLAANSALFVLDPKTQTIVHRADLSEFGAPLRSGQRLQPDGSIIALFSRAIVRIDAKAFGATMVATPPKAISAGMGIVGKRLVFGCGAEVWSYELP